MLYVDTVQSHSVTVRHPDHSEIKIPLTFNGEAKAHNLSQYAMTTLINALGSIGTNDKIEAIKLARIWFKLGLLEAKLLVEQAKP
jgi:ribosomal protein L7/L12